MTDYSTWTYKLGDLLTKTKGSCWTGRVVGFYQTELTAEGYAIESINEPGSVQIYPVSALRRFDPERDVHPMVKDARDRIEALNAEVARLRGLFASLAIDADACAVSRQYARAALGDEA